MTNLRPSMTVYLEIQQWSHYESQKGQKIGTYRGIIPDILQWMD